ncbi:MAG: excinuclease ABC subunit B [Candidatus Melainabacteria bacterium HGW-Melainabacteria-1]|nr:MAG: excinuclease ABC subunit B [Candidatus Melainabacteria bacterium HGW-Melainabacteria-1]
MSFRLQGNYQPAGDQPQAISALYEGLIRGDHCQTLLGVTGSGKTFTVANVIEKVQRPTLVIAHNKTLAAQLSNELREFFPDNAVEYFISYYDYYRPEAYLPSSDTFIEKTAAVNEEIDRLRHSATRSLFERRDVIIVASVSCIYGLGTPEEYLKAAIPLKTGQQVDLKKLLYALTENQYQRNDYELGRAMFRVRGEMLEIGLPYEEKLLRIEFFDNEIERISEVDPVSGKRVRDLARVRIYPAKHFVMPPEELQRAMSDIEAELEGQLKVLKDANKLLEAQRLEQRTRYDLEMLAEVGYCNGIENYSRHMEGRVAHSPPSTLIDYFPEDFLCVIDESHVTLPQLRGMYEGDRSRKQTLIDHGFRLPSALDNRPLKFDEFWAKMNQMIFVSATPGDFDIQQSAQVVEQIVRPTGLLDPLVEVRPLENQVDDLIGEITTRVARKERVLVTTLTKKMAEDLTNYLSELNIQVQYLHSDIQAIERIEILAELREGKFDVLIGVNLLREGLDLPEVSMVAILDADKEGFLRSHRALIQTIGRAARNVSGQVILYGNRMTDSMALAVGETERRRALQQAHNLAEGITPTQIVKGFHNPLLEKLRAVKKTDPLMAKTKLLPDGRNLDELIGHLEKEMRIAADMLDFERAVVMRDQLKELQSLKKQGGT